MLSLALFSVFGGPAIIEFYERRVTRQPRQGTPRKETSDVRKARARSPHSKRWRVNTRPFRFMVPLRDFEILEAAHKPCSGGDSPRFSGVHPPRLLFHQRLGAAKVG